MAIYSFSKYDISQMLLLLLNSEHPDFERYQMVPRVWFSHLSRCDDLSLYSESNKSVRSDKRL